jgi:hypothetical protein
MPGLLLIALGEKKREFKGPFIPLSKPCQWIIVVDPEEQPERPEDTELRKKFDEREENLSLALWHLFLWVYFQVSCAAANTVRPLTIDSLLHFPVSFGFQQKRL